MEVHHQKRHFKPFLHLIPTEDWEILPKNTSSRVVPEEDIGCF